MADSYGDELLQEVGKTAVKVITTKVLNAAINVAPEKAARLKVELANWARNGEFVTHTIEKNTEEIPSDLVPPGQYRKFKMG